MGRAYYNRGRYTWRFRIASFCSSSSPSLRWVIVATAAFDLGGAAVSDEEAAADEAGASGGAADVGGVGAVAAVAPEPDTAEEAAEEVHVFHGCSEHCYFAAEPRALAVTSL